ncbi:hypothetical protein AABB24_039707 [Solanum stoloniferum]|uniref:Secreted protein n=1 Tax=Solanum stoloniferum TaxID=62892 RepID=A0ABD2QRP0_9SOLN
MSITYVFSLFLLHVKSVRVHYELPLPFAFRESIKAQFLSFRVSPLTFGTGLGDYPNFAGNQPKKQAVYILYTAVYMSKNAKTGPKRERTRLGQCTGVRKQENA